LGGGHRSLDARLARAVLYEQTVGGAFFFPFSVCRYTLLIGDRTEKRPWRAVARGGSASALARRAAHSEYMGTSTRFVGELPLRSKTFGFAYFCVSFCENATLYWLASIWSRLRYVSNQKLWKQPKSAHINVIAVKSLSLSPANQLKINRNYFGLKKRRQFCKQW